MNHDDILARTSIEDVYERLSGYSAGSFMRFGPTRLVRCVSQSHPVKRGGVRDAHPSCAIHPENKTWHCFACGGSSGLLGLIIAAGKATTTREAIEWLKSGVGETRKVYFSANRVSGSVSAVLRDEIETACYSYVDADGTLQYQVIRKEGYDRDGVWSKRFLQRRPYEGAWIYHLGATCQKARKPNCPCHWPKASKARVSTQMLPYRLPELIAAAKTKRVIFLVEGEKCADALVQLGLVATTPSGGANAALRKMVEAPPVSILGEIWEEALAGAYMLVVIPDCDVPGRDAANAHLARLKPHVKTALLLDIAPERLEDAYDISDWIDEQHRTGMTRDEIVSALKMRILDAIKAQKTSESQAPSVAA